MADNDDFREVTERQDALRRQRDFDDLQNDIAGRETGRQKRTFVGEASKGAESRRARNAIAADLTALDLLLADPIYAARHQEVSNLLSGAEETTETALAESESALAQAQDELGDLLENANCLPDGTKVFRNADGRVFTEDGRLVGAEEAASIHWNDEAPTYEDYIRRKQAVETLALRIEELRRFQIDVLGVARDRLNDPDNPPSLEELEDIGNEIQAGLEKVANAPKATDSSPNNTFEATSGIGLPDIGGSST